MRAAEQGEHREVGLPVPAVRRGVDQPRSVGRPQHVARPQVAVQPGRWFGRPGERGQPLAHALDHGGLVGGQVARRRGRSAGRAPPGARRTRAPSRRPRRCASAPGRSTRPSVRRAARHRRRGRPLAWSAASRVPRSAAAAAEGRPGGTYPVTSPASVSDSTSGTRRPARHGQPPEPGRLRRDPRPLLDDDDPSVGQLHPGGTAAQGHGSANGAADDRARGSHSWALTYSSSPGVAARIIVSTSVNPSGPP